MENNQGVAFLESGDLRRALEHFSRTLGFTMGLFAPSPPNHEPSFASTPVQQGPAFVTVVSSTTAPEPTTVDSTKCLTPRLESSAPQPPSPPRSSSIPAAPPTSATFAYTRGIKLIPHPNAYSPDPLINQTIVSSIVIFNMSLVYHLKGLTGSCGMRTMRLLKAQALYQKSHNLLVDAGVPLTATGNPVIDVLSMALYNNLAQLSFELSRYDESRKLFDYLVRFALTVVPSRYGDVFVGSMLEQQKSSFLLNAIILQEPRFAAAA